MSTTQPTDANIETLLTSAEAWHAQDPDPDTSLELGDLITRASTGDADAVRELHARFDERLAFGTAGLRGEMGAGPNRMNRVLVSQAAAGFAAYLLDTYTDPTIVIGFDGRYKSLDFAKDTAEIMTAAGVKAILMPRELPTPVTAFALRHLDLTAAVMVTASHNPGKDNGYKVYLGGADEGSQIISPTDVTIARYIDEIAEGVKVPDIPRSDDYDLVSEAVIDAYVAETVATLTPGARDISFVYTAMHGVGWEVAARVFRDAGFDLPTIVTEQITPDPAFPTVPFPNPEEPGAMDLSFALASQVGAELIIANDPDADRLAVAIPDATSDAGWRRLTGNEVGALLGEHIASVLPEASRPGKALAQSLVSSPLLGKIAERYGLAYVQTLTGFKFVNRVPGLIFGYEEALGYLVDPDLVRDKDGVSAAGAFLVYAAALKAKGKTIADALDDLVDAYGRYDSDQVSVRVEDLAQIGRIMSSLRDNPPTEFAGIAVETTDDFLVGVADLPTSDVLRYYLADGSRVIFRPSGTEPKLKVYLDVAATDGDRRERYADAARKLTELRAAVEAIVAS